jgi:ubiquinone/menaquinone biosynthesis C-methylase UbiE
LRFDRSSAAAFGSVAECYERRRPGYPPELVAWLTGRLGLAPGRTVVDVGAGTGKLTRQLVPGGARVIAVEPLPEMRAQLESAVPEAEVLAGSAEELPLGTGGADAVTVAAAIHWFLLDRALPEFRRVLRPGGGLGVVQQFRDPEDALQQAVDGIVGAYLPDASEFPRWRDAVAASGLFGPVETFEAANEQLFDADGLAERVATISYVARLPDGERTEVLARLRALGEAQPQSPFPFRYRTVASVCRRL